jgi:hypothetical protein
MQPKWKRRLGLVALAGAVAYGSVGCAAERDPINQVQANALSKHLFVGPSLTDTSDDPEFYMRNTVVDVPYGAAQDGLFTATYAQPLTRVKWEVKENVLIARATHERIDNSDHKGSRTTNDGQVVAMFRIISHFDIRRAYNPQTGEELNIVVENASDRPWYDREYMRVDWSQNMVTDGYEVDTLSMLGMFGAIRWSPMSYWDGDPKSPDAPVVDEATGYFDVTTKAFASPQMLDTPWGQYPACWFPASWGGGYPYANCNPTEVTLRLSFKRVTDTDFEPTEFNGNQMEAFGWFLQERLGYERNYGILDQRWHRFAAKYNTFEKNHIEGTQCAVDYWRDASGKIQNYRVDESSPDGFAHDPNTGLPIPDPNGKPFPGGKPGVDIHKSSDGVTEDVCAFTNGAGDVVHPGSRCDEFAGKCTLPFRERRIKTIPWYYGPDAPADLFPSTAFAVREWNLAMKRAILIGQKADADRVCKYNRAECADLAAPFSGSGPNGYLTEEEVANADTSNPLFRDVLVLCHNPVVEGDDVACGKVGTRARLGDLRYNIVNIINNPQTPSPWGIMVDADDPLTGEKIQTSVNEWGHVLDLFSQSAVDLIKYLNGEISDENISNGTYMQAWVNGSQLGTKPFRPTTLSKQDIQSRLGSIDTSLAKLNGLTAEDQKTLPKELREAKAAKNLQQALGPGIDNKFEALRQKLIGSPAEIELLTPEQLQMGGFDPRTPVAGDPTALAKASPLRGLNPQMMRWMNRMRNTTMMRNHACMVEQPEPSSVVGLARQANALFPPPAKSDPDYVVKLIERDKKMHQWLREQFHISVILHEMGHSVGLRHNFVSNVDALNFFTQYWQLRTRNGKEPLCSDATTPHTNGADCVGPRWIDPVTETEVNGMIWKWGATTVMDYPGDITQDTNYLGSYDKAAMRFMYGEVVDVDEDARQNSQKGKDYLAVLDGFGGIGGRTIGGWHYTAYASKYGALGTCENDTDPNDPLKAKCSGFKLDHIAVRDMKTVPKYPQYGEWLLKIRPDLVAPFAVDPLGRVRHPYMFGSDEYADTGNVPVFRFDSGADAYEQVQFLTSVYENRYIFDNFRRNRVGFNTYSVATRAMSRYYDKLQGMTKSLALMIGYEQNPDQALQDPGGLMPLGLAASDALSFFTKILTRPEPGNYRTISSTPVPFAQADLFEQQPDFIVSPGNGEGRYLHNDYDYSKGYWWSSYQLFAGTNIEKRATIYFLLEAYNNFVSNQKEDYVDGRYKNLNFASIYPQQIRRLMSGIMQGDPLTLGPYVTVPAQMPKDRILSVRYLPWERYTSSDPGTISLNYPANAVVIDPLVGWEQQYPSLLWAFIFGRTNLTMDMIDQMRVWVPNSNEAVSVALSEQVRFRNPYSGVVYAARTYGTEVVNNKVAPVQKTVGARMIQYANQLAAQAFYQTGTVTDEDGFVHPVYDVNNPKDAMIAAKCKGFVSNLEQTRWLAGFLGFFGGGSGGD